MLTAAFWGFTANVNALTIDMDTIICSTNNDCASLNASGSSNPAAEIANIQAAFGVTGLSLLYKDNVGSGEETAPFKDSYST